MMKRFHGDIGLIRYLIIISMGLIIGGCSSRPKAIPPQVPNNPVVKLSQAGEYLRKGQCDRALSLYDEVVKSIEGEKGIIPAQKAEVHYYRGLALACLKQFDAAKQAFQKALAIEPLYHPARNGLAMIATEMGQYDEAERIYLSLLKVPDYPQAAVYFNLANLYIKQGEWTRAVFVARKAVELAPDELGPRLLFARILDRMGMKQDALAQYRIIVQKWPQNLEAVHHLARLYEGQQQYCEAKKLFWRILELDPVGEYAEEATVKIQTLPCDKPIQTVPPPKPKDSQDDKES